MLLSSKYQSSMLITVTIAGYTLNIAILGLFSKRLFSWYKMNRASVVVVLYAISFTIAALSSLVAAVEDSFLIAAKQAEVTQKAEVAFPSFGQIHCFIACQKYTTIVEQCCITDEHPYQTLLLSIFLS
jgi:maltodextrin utilization protein YvdJ